ncbi:MAG TPA: HAMP domain-containing sensor histidine kinase [Actinomycetota bacterium]|nr:HAMP domain-containing sensor histidine kinase [Actinomycetota bacterium]
MLFTSAIVVGALLLLGAALHALLAKSLYTQQNYDAVQQVKLLTRPGEISDVSGVNTEQIQDALKDQLIKRLGGQPNFEAVVLRGEDGTPSSSDEDFRIEHVPAGLVERVERGNELAYVYIRSPVGPGRMLVVGAPIRLDQSDAGAQQAYFFYPLNFQEETLAKLSNFLLIVGAGLLAAVVILAAISIGRVLKPIQRARDVAEEIAAGNLAARIPQATSQDDFGKLAESFNRMTDNLAQKIGELEHVGSLQARFVSDVSHELRTPLATVRMAADYIHAARAGLPPDAQRAAVLLERELERFENLLEDLLEISRFDAGVINLEPVEVDLSGLLDEVVDALDPIAHGRKVDVALEVDRSQGQPLVAADPRRLDRVFSNLVKNAIEHTVEGGVRIWVGRRARDVVVTVADEGEGIPAEDLPHIFERFYRADVHRARTLGGTGLGLAIALENVNLHRGSIDVQSEVGQGSTFTVTLPAIDPKPEPADGRAAEPQPEPAPVPEVAVGG